MTTCLPASSACLASSKCVAFGVVTTISSIAVSASISPSERTIRAAGKALAASSPLRCKIAAKRSPVTALTNGA